MNDHLLRRLTLPKFLFRQAQQVLEHPQPPHSWGLAASLLQDSVEVFLRVVAEHAKARVGSNAPFPKLLDAVESRVGGVAGHRHALTTLNDTRVAFKHRGQEIAESAARVFLANVDAFLVEVCRETFGIDFEALSLADTIGHRRTQNWLQKAEDAFDDERYADAVRSAAAAMTIYLRHDRDHDAAPRPAQLPTALPFPYESGGIARSIEWLGSRVDLMVRGIDVRAFDQFTALTPLTSLTMTGTFGSVWTPGVVRSRQEARFCIDFVIEAALALRESRHSQSMELHCKEHATVKSACEIVVYPKVPDGELEVIREAEIGEVLVIAAERRGYDANDEFAAIMQDGDVAYVRRDCVDIDEAS